MSDYNYGEGCEGVKQSAQTGDDRGLSLYGVLGEDFHMGLFSKRRPEERGGARHAKCPRKGPKLRTRCAQEPELGEVTAEKN